MGSTESHGKMLFLVKWKSWLAKNHSTTEPFECVDSVGAKKDLRVFHSKNPEMSQDSRLTDSD
jgi:hypothetical protein